MPHVLIVNPIEDKGARNMAKKARSAAQKRATAKMIAANRRMRRAKNPSTALTTAAANPRGKSKRRRSSGRKVTYYRRKNPIGRGGFALDKFLSSTLMPAAAGAGGALAIDVLLGVLPLPPALKSGLMRPVVRIGGALGMGALAGMLGGRRIGEQVAAGGLTVLMYDTLRALMPKVLPGVPLAANDLELAYYQAGQEVGAAEEQAALEAMDDDAGVSAYVDDGMGEYVDEYVSE